MMLVSQSFMLNSLHALTTFTSNSSCVYQIRCTRHQTLDINSMMDALHSYYHNYDNVLLKQ